MRVTDLDKVQYERSSRFTKKNGQWYFKTRDNGLKGPYSSYEEAQDAMEFYLALTALKEYRPQPYVL